MSQLIHRIVIKRKKKLKTLMPGQEHIEYNRKPNASIWFFQLSPGRDLMISESPGSTMLRHDTLKYFPQAVPRSTLSEQG